MQPILNNPQGGQAKIATPCQLVYSLSVPLFHDISLLDLLMKPAFSM
jgi:hypothetical protein